MAHIPVVAVINTSSDIVDILRVTFERAGFVVVTSTTVELRDGEVDIERFMRQHNPDAIVYDIAPPYEENFRLFQHMRQIPEVGKRPVVLTSTNVRHLQPLVEEGTELHEIIGKPYDLEEIVDAVRRAMAGR